MDQINLTAWTGRMIEDDGQITPATARLIHATLGDPDTPAPAAGDVLPPLWHWCAFPPEVPMAALGEDGHPVQHAYRLVLAVAECACSKVDFPEEVLVNLGGALRPCRADHELTCQHRDQYHGC